MKSPEKKQFKDIKDSELERLKKKDSDERIRRLMDKQNYTYDEAALIVASEDAKELIEREGSIEGEEDREKARKNKIK